MNNLMASPGYNQVRLSNGKQQPPR